MSYSKLRQEADKLWRQRVMDRWGMNCEICGSPVADFHHFIRKGECQYLRLNVDNGVPLCRKHHRMIDHRGSEEKEKIEGQIIARRGKAWYDNLKKIQEQAPTSFINEDWYKKNIIWLKRQYQKRKH